MTVTHWNAKPADTSVSWAMVAAEIHEASNDKVFVDWRAVAKALSEEDVFDVLDTPVVEVGVAHGAGCLFQPAVDPCSPVEWGRRSCPSGGCVTVFR